MMFDEDDSGKTKDVKGEEKPKEKEILKPVILPGPYKTKVEVIRQGNFRIDGKVYDMVPGSVFDGEKLGFRKLEILINTRFIKKI